MAAIIQQVSGMLKRTWECKQCHQTVAEEHTIAYHLIDGILYGWCDACFNQQSVNKAAIARSTV
jgi:hypothetical protein